jgi:hypothetical protein
MPLTPTGALSYAHLNANGATTLKSAAGWLHTVTINSKGATGNTATLYDNTTASGTVIAVIDTTAQIQTLLLDAAFATGLTVVLASGTSADITVSYL